MKLINTFIWLIISTSLYSVPFLAHADISSSKGRLAATFENLQKLRLGVQISYSPSPTGAHESQTIFTYQAGQIPAGLLDSDKFYLDLWKGSPFTPTAHLIRSWDITSSSTGQVSMPTPEAGSYFLVAYFPDDFYQHPESICSDYENPKSVCAPPYTLDQMRPYFTTPLNTPTTDLFLYAPEAFGGIRFSVPEMISTQKSRYHSGPSGSNVLFIPGTLTSRLYMRNADGSERDLWEPRSNLDISPLTMKSDGTSVNHIYTRDVIDKLYSNNSLYYLLAQAAGSDMDVYGSFEAYLSSLVSNGTIKRWQAYPYDWRYDVRDIVANGTLVGTATSTPVTVRLQNILQDLALSSPTKKVTIVAHSNGGLIAKALAIDLASRHETGLIDRIILIGTPQFGTPKSVIDLLHGDEFTTALGIVMYGDTVRTTEATMPGAYDLLPSSFYFSNTTFPVATFDSKNPAALFRKSIGGTVRTFSQLSYFLTDAFHLDLFAGELGSLKTPIQLSKDLIQKAKRTHDQLDGWTPPAGLEVDAIAGWGQLTPITESYSGKQGLTCDRTSFFIPFACSLLPQLQPSIVNGINGDDTVVSESALGGIRDRFYFDTSAFKKNSGINITHKSLLSASPVQNFLKTILTNLTPSSAYISHHVPQGSLNPLIVVSAHSPVTLLATDESGKQSGIIPLPGLNGVYFQKEEISGSSVQEVGEEKYVYLPKNQNYKIAVVGYGTGTTTINVDSVSEQGALTHLSEYADIPTTASTSATLRISGDGTTTPLSGNIMTLMDSTQHVPPPSTSNMGINSINQLLEQFLDRCETLLFDKR